MYLKELANSGSQATIATMLQGRNWWPAIGLPSPQISIFVSISASIHIFLANGKTTEKVVGFGKIYPVILSFQTGLVVKS